MTGFEPFASHEENISQQIIDSLSSESQKFYSLETDLLTVDEKGSRRTSERINKGEKFHAILHLGFSESTKNIRLERLAKNQYKMEIPDNSGRQITKGVIENVPRTLLETNSPINELNEVLNHSREVIWSNDAGGFVCNETYFRTLLSSLDSESVVVLFAHLPSKENIPVFSQLEIIRKICNCLCGRKHFRVSSGLLIDDRGRALSCRRPPGDSWTGMWEFPGGKIESGESSREAVIREIEEELGVSVNPGREITVTDYSYDDWDISLHLWHCGVVDSGSIRLMEHDQVRWLSKEEILEVDWLPADLPIVKEWARKGIPPT